MPDKIFQPFSKGLNLLSDAVSMPENTTPDCGNVHISAGGQAVQRDGSSIDLVSVASWPFTNNDSGCLFVMEDTFYAQSNPLMLMQLVAGEGMTTGQIVAIEETRGTDVKTAFNIRTYTLNAGTVKDRPYGVNFMGTGPVYENILCVGRANTPQKITGAAATPSATDITHSDWTAAGEYPTTCASYAGRMWYSGNPSYPGRLWASESGASAAFAGTGAPAALAMDLNLTAGGRIIGLHSLYDILIVFTTQGIYRVVGSDATNFSSSFVSPIPAVSQHSITLAINELYFLSQGSVYRIATTLDYGDVKVEEVGGAIAPAIEDTPNWKLAGAVSVFDEVHKRLIVFTHSDYNFARDTAGLTDAISQATVDAQLDLGYDPYLPSSHHALVFDVRAGGWSRASWPQHFKYVVTREAGDGEHVVEAYTVAMSVPAGQKGTHIAEFKLFNEDLLTDGTFTNSATASAPTTGTAAVEAYYRMKHIHATMLAKRKSHPFLTTVLRNEEKWAGGVADRGSCTLNYALDYGPMTQTAGEIYADHPMNVETVGLAASVSPFWRYRAMITGSAATYQFEFYNNTSDRRFAVQGANLNIEVRGQR